LTCQLQRPALPGTAREREIHRMVFVGQSRIFMDMPNWRACPATESD
jgi:hypothetical protein